MELVPMNRNRSFIEGVYRYVIEEENENNLYFTAHDVEPHHSLRSDRDLLENVDALPVFVSLPM